MECGVLNCPLPAPFAPQVFRKRRNPKVYLNGFFTATRAHQALIDNTRILNPSPVNEFRMGFNHFFNDIGGELNYVRDPIKELGTGRA